MRKITVSEFVSLDGVIQEPMWTVKYWNDEIADFKKNELFSHDALLLGRITYDSFAQAWPGRKDEEGYADRMNNLPKYAVSTTLQGGAKHSFATKFRTGSWNNTTIIRDNVADEIAALKRQDGQDILVFGSGALIKTLMENDLVDRYNLLIYPVVLGKGQRLFADGSAARLKLVESRSFSSGVVAMIYEPSRKL